MPTTPGDAIRTIADVVKVVMKCSDKQANEAELEMCKSPNAMAKLLAACELSKASVGYGGLLIVAGAGSGGSTAVVGVTLTATGLMGARRFCSAAVKLGAGIPESN